MVTEALSKVNQTVKQTMKYIGHLAVVTRADISFSEENNIAATSLQVKNCLLEIIIRIVILMLISHLFSVTVFRSALLHITIKLNFF